MELSSFKKVTSLDPNNDLIPALKKNQDGSFTNVNINPANMPAGILAVGIATLSSGTVTVSTTQVTSNCGILLTAQDSNTAGYIRVSGRTIGTSFTIESSNTADTGNIFWQIIQLT